VFDDWGGYLFERSSLPGTPQNIVEYYPVHCPSGSLLFWESPYRFRVNQPGRGNVQGFLPFKQTPIRPIEAQHMPNMPSSAATALMLLTLALPIPVVAQDETNAAPAPASTELKNHQDWSVQCATSPESTDGQCVLFQHLDVESGQRLLTMQVSRLSGGRDDGQEARALVITVPLGVHLPSGMRLQVDDGPPIDLSYERCDQGGCYAGTILNEELLKAMMQGEKSRVRFNNLNGKSITATLSLLGFAEGFRALGQS
jgi:invasion protein IalB